MFIRLASRFQPLALPCEGRGHEPRIELSNMYMQFDPTPPNTWTERQLTISNPCHYPIEVFSVNYDKQHLEEEKVGYNLFNI